MNQLLEQLKQLFFQYSIKQRLIIISILIAFLSSVVVIVLWANRTEYVLLYSNLDADVAGSIVDDLRSNKVPYRLENGGTTIFAPKDQISELRIGHAQSGFIKDSVTGYELFEQNNMGMTTFMQKLNFKRALEGELMRTISQFPEIRNCRVHLVIPEDKLFEGRKKGSASVVLHLRHRESMNNKQLKGIASLVANSVDGIESGDVVVMDDDGQILIDHSDEQNPLLGAVGSQFELQGQLETQLQQKVTAIVAGIVGSKNTVVKVSAELNFDQIERIKDEIDPENSVIVSQEKFTETSLSDIDTAKYNMEKVTSNYAFSKTSEKFISNSGDIRRLTVAVLVNEREIENKNEEGEKTYTYQPRTEEELSQITALVKSAVGYSEDRGDLVEVKNIKFAETQLRKDQEYFSDGVRFDLWENIISYVLMGIGILLAFFLLKGFLKSSVSQLGLPSLAPAGAPAGLFSKSQSEPGALSAASAPPAEQEIHEDIFMKKLSPEARAKMKAQDKMTTEVITFAEENPENATKLLRTWLTKSGTE